MEIKSALLPIPQSRSAIMSKKLQEFKRVRVGMSISETAKKLATYSVNIMMTNLCDQVSIGEMVM